MNTFLNLIKKRRSIRRYLDKPISADDVALLLQAGLLAPTSRNSRSCHFVAVENKETLHQLSKSKRGGCKFIENSPLAIVVGADPSVGEVWVENASIAATFIQLQAESLGLGSCWVQIRGRQTAEGYDAQSYVRDIINAPMALQILAIITVGYPDEEKPEHDIEQLNWNQVHADKF